MSEESPDIFYLDSRSCKWSYRDEYAESTVAISKAKVEASYIPLEYHNLCMDEFEAKVKQDKQELIDEIISWLRVGCMHKDSDMIYKLKCLKRDIDNE